MLSIGVVGTSLKENERRLPVYPEHLPWIPEDVRRCMWFEEGYGSRLRYPDEYFKGYAAGCLPRDTLMTKMDLLLLPKATELDLRSMKLNAILCGWCHCVQNKRITQAAIDRRLTLIAWEAMHLWGPNSQRLVHIFYKNNEIAGYAAVLHALQLLGADGLYGPRRHVAVIGFGAVSRGAIYALHGRGFNNIHVYTRRPVHAVEYQNPDVYYHHVAIDSCGRAVVKEPWGEQRPLIEDLAKADYICNGILQNPDSPLVFVRSRDVEKLKPGAAIIDISCDEGMGFEFAKPTTFDEPTFIVGDRVVYYSVDHTPSYLWDAASREISRALVPFLDTIAAGQQAWSSNDTIRRAIEISGGCIQNRTILSFQNRTAVYPHACEEG